MKNFITLLGFYICLITNVVAQDCSLTANVISFENSQKDTLAVYFKNKTIVGINTTAPTGQNSALLILDSEETILSIIPDNPSSSDDCSLFYRLEDDVFVDTSAHDFYQIVELSWDSLVMNPSTGQNIDDMMGCFVLSNYLQVIDFRLNSFDEIANLPDNVNDEYLNIFGGGTALNGVLNRNAESSINICRQDSLNKSFGTTGAFGPAETWVVTDRSGVVIALLDLPVFDFQAYFEQVVVSSTLHELELFYIAYSGSDDWLDIGANIKTNLCNVPSSNRSTLYEINLIECEDTCNDNFLNGNEITLDNCVIDSMLTCRISAINDVDCFGELTGSATVEVTGGIGPFEFLWDTGDSTASVDSLGAGVYDVTVFDAIGSDTMCTVIINQADSLSVEILLNSVGNCSASVIVVGGQEPIQREWSTGESFISISNLDSIQSVTVTDALGCTATATIDPEQLSMICGNCGDGVMNGEETGIDCGGTCAPCEVVMDSLDIHSLQLVKRVEFVDENSNGFMEEGETVNYLFSVCNAGTVELTQVFINDPLVTVVGDTISLDAMSCNASAFTGSYTLTAEDLEAGRVTNQATASAILQDSIMISDLSDDSDILMNVDVEGDGEPDDPTVLIMNLVGPCGVVFMDNDMDGTCDAEDTDDDNDGVLDINDAFPFNSFESVDTDGDGFGNNGDFDDDNDLVDDRSDAFPLDPTESVDTDGDGVGDNADMNDDGDACDDIFDNDPFVASETCMVETGCDSLIISDSTVVFSGTVSTDIGFTLDSVEVAVVATGVRDTSLSGTDGVYNSSSLPNELDYIIRPSKEDLPFRGVSTLDMLFVQRHILRLDQLSNPYKIIAGDVSGNASISIVDIILMRQMILGVIDDWNEGVSWKFVDAEFEFFDPTVPWPFRSAKEISNANISRCNIDFIAVKLGDVDNSYENNNLNQTEIRGNKDYTLKYRKQQLDNGNYAYAFFMPEDNLLYGMQFGLQVLGGRPIAIHGAGIDIDESDVVTNETELKLSWTNPYGNQFGVEDVLFTMESKTEIDFNLNATDVTPEIYIEESIEQYTLHLIEDSELIALNPSFKPNPFQHSTMLSFSLDSPQSIDVNVFDSSGTVYWTLSRSLLAGDHVISIPEHSLPQAGLYFYTIESKGKSYSGKLIKSD